MDFHVEGDDPQDKIMIKATRVSWQPDNAHPYGHYRINKSQYKATVP